MPVTKQRRKKSLLAQKNARTRKRLTSSRVAEDASQRIAELERQVEHNKREIAVVAKALKHVEGLRRK